MPYVHPKLTAYDVQVASIVGSDEISARLKRGRERVLKLSNHNDFINDELDNSELNVSFLK